MGTVAVSPGGATIAIGGREGIELRDLSSGRMEVLATGGAATGSLAFSPDGAALAAADDDGMVRIWRLRGASGRRLDGSGAGVGEPMLVRNEGAVLAMAFAAAGAEEPGEVYVATAGRDRTVRLWDRQGRLLRALVGHRAAIRALALSGSGAQLGSVGEDGEVRRWELAEGRPVRLSGHRGWLTRLCALDGARLLSAGSDQRLLLWDLEAGSSRALTGHTGAVRDLAVSGDGRRAVSGGDDGTVRLWELPAGEGRVLGGHVGAVLAVAIAQDGRRAASGGADHTVRLWELSAGEATGRVLGSHRGPVAALAFSADGRRLLSAGADSDALLWDAAGRDGPRADRSAAAARPRRLEHPAEVTAIAISHGGAAIATATRSGGVYLWGAAGDGPRTLASHRGPVRYLAFAPDDGAVASASDDATAQLTGLDGRLRLRAGHDDFVRRVAFSGDGRSLATAGEDGTVRLWDIASGEVRILRDRGWVADVAFLPGGRAVAAGGADGALSVWPDDLPEAPGRLRRWMVATAGGQGEAP
jgi:WD40 repeat protein